MAIKKKPGNKAKASKSKKPSKKATKSKVAKTAKKKSAKKAPPRAVKKVAKKPKKTSLLDRIALHRRELEEAKSKSEKSGEKLFKQAVKEIFSSFPELTSFYWDQYTPHWNDGDACTFGCHLESMSIVFKDREDSEDLWSLQHLDELFSGDIEKKKKDLEAELAKAKEEWQKNSLKSNLEDLKTKPEDVKKIKESYLVKKTIVDLLQGIDESVYENMFGEGTINVTRDDITVSECEHD